MAIKVDMEKACDKLEWSCIMHILEAFSFNPQWLQWTC